MNNDLLFKMVVDLCLFGGLGYVFYKVVKGMRR